MEFAELVKNRYSCRAFAERAVEPEKLMMVLEAGRLSPTAVNGQPVIVKVLESSDSLKKIRGLTRMAYNAPVVIMVCYDDTKVYSPTTYMDDFKSGIMDASIVATTMMMQATDLGLSTLWARGFSAAHLEHEFGFPENIKLACLLDVGYADPVDGLPSPRHDLRKPMNEFAEEV